MTLSRLEELSALEKLSEIQYLNKYGEKLDIYYSGWECDEIVWKVDNTLFRTNHGKLYLEEKQDFLKYIKELEEYILEAKHFLRT